MDIQVHYGAEPQFGISRWLFSESCGQSISDLYHVCLVYPVVSLSVTCTMSV